MAFDGIVTKAIASELQQLSGARIDKIFQPNSNNVILGFYLKGNNYALNISTNPSNYRINLTTHSKSNPKVAPNFCMVLRKHLIGLHIKNIITKNLERVVTIEFEGFDDVDDVVTKKLIVELMGRHCNIVLLDDNNIIIDSLRHINDENSTRVVIPHIKYTYPKSDKLNFLEYTDFKDFSSALSCDNIDSFPLCISNTFNGISKNFIKFIINKLETSDLEKIYTYLSEVVSNTDSLNLELETFDNDYFLVPYKSNHETFSLNFFIDDFYYIKESSDDLKNYRNSILKLILSTLKKYNKRLENIDEKLKSCENMDMYKLYGELITANLYRIPNKNIDSIEIENYYDNNNIITIPLDSKYTPSVNAKRFFKKYNKLKNTLEIVSIQKKETINELNYIKSIVYELETAISVQEISEIFDEISENVIFKDKTDSLKTKNSIKTKMFLLTR